MKDAQKPDHISLNTLIGYLRQGRYVIPDFQRDFEWRPWDIRDLTRSIFLDYYIGSLLLWKGKQENFEALSCKPIYGFTGKGSSEYIVLDGQQRLTAMHYVFLAPDIHLQNRTNRFFYFINVERFMAEEYDLAFNYERQTRKVTALLADRAAQYEAHLFPMSIIGAGGWELGNWVQGYVRHWQEKAAGGDRAAAHHAEHAAAFGEHLRGITEQYQISYIELDRDIEVDKVCDIFVQTNSKGIRLDVFDLINALLKPKGLQLRYMWEEAAPRLDFVDSEKLNVYVLQVMSILRQAYCSPKYLYYLLPGQEKTIRDPDGGRRKEVLIGSVGEFEREWNTAISALEDAIKLLRHPQEFGAVSSGYLPYVSILPAFAALQAHVKTLPAGQRLTAQRKIRHWYWASVFTNRYSGSVESTSARDFLDVRAWLEDDDAEPAPILEFKTRFRSLDLRNETKSGTSVYNGIFNLFVIQGARDWMTGNIPQYGDLDDHHIVPQSWGPANLGGNRVHTILNRSPLSAETNRHVIRKRLPNEYLPELIAENGEAAVRAILESHFISPAALQILLRNPFTPADFDDFITERQLTLLRAIETLLIKERLDLEPHLRELDERIETVELDLRAMVAAALGGDVAALPPHVVQKADERIQRSIRQNPALDADHYRTMAGKLEFCDLREIQDVIVGKAGWPAFQSAFASKEGLNTKFTQLAELRNGIRHSRTVDEVTRMEGEAAIKWFGQILARSAPERSVASA